MLPSFLIFVYPDISSAVLVDDEVIEIKVADLAGWPHTKVETQEDDGLQENVFVLVFAVGSMVELVDDAGKGYFDVVFVVVDRWRFHELFPLV
ncbi:MAG: hypothetical protein QXX20_03765 [Candidatus Thermoplasmatota archaeon]